MYPPQPTEPEHPHSGFQRLPDARKKHPEFHVRTCDVAKKSDCKSLAEWTGASFKDLNILVNNAGVQRDIDFTA
ncbi:MAG: SDR family NAD(P)-dependent oxidoreductase [Polyangia bacterium]